MERRRLESMRLERMPFGEKAVCKEGKWKDGGWKGGAWKKRSFGENVCEGQAFMKGVGGRKAVKEAWSDGSEGRRGR